jgi:CRP-like cAMP-binding protein
MLELDQPMAPEMLEVTSMRDELLHEAVHDCGACPLGPHATCQFKPRKVEAGTQLWGQGEAEVRLSFVKEGLFGISATDAEGRELLAGVRGPRSMLGLEALASEPVARATVVALADSTVCVTREAPTDTKALLDFALDELGQMTRDADLRSGPALSRLARFILRHGALVAPGQRAPFSKRHVAQLLGLRPETLSRCLRELLDEKLVDAHLAVLDSAKLQRLAEGELSASGAALER